MDLPDFPPGTEDYEDELDKLQSDREKKSSELEFDEYLKGLKLSLEDGTTGCVVEKRDNKEKKAPLYLCHPCAVSIYGVKSAKSHIDGRKHLENLENQKSWPKDIYDKHPFDLMEPETETSEVPVVRTARTEASTHSESDFQLDSTAVCGIQPLLDAHVGDDLIGLEYLLEILPGADHWQPVYQCIMCSVNLHKNTVIPHFINTGHKSKYLSLNFHAEFKTYSEEHIGTPLKNMVDTIVSAIVKKYGRLSPMQCGSHHWKTHRTSVCKAARHRGGFSEKLGHTFMDFLDQPATTVNDESSATSDDKTVDPASAESTQPADDESDDWLEREFAEYVHGLTIPLGGGSVGRMADKLYHKKKGRWMYFCYPCSAVLQSEICVKEHFNGRKHSVNLQTCAVWSQDIYNHRYLKMRGLQPGTSTLPAVMPAPTGTSAIPASMPAPLDTSTISVVLSGTLETTTKPIVMTAPPGLEEPELQLDWNAACVIQPLLDSCNKVPLIGVEYLLEIMPDSLTLKYFCVLCPAAVAADCVIKHLTENKHRLRYLASHFPKVNSAFGKSKGKNSKEVLDKIIADIEEKYGRMLPVKCTQSQWHKYNSVICEEMKKREHFSEKPDMKLDEVLEQHLNLNTNDSSSGVGDTDVTKNAEGQQEEKQVASAPVVAVNSQPANVTSKKEPEKKLAEYLLQGLTLEDGTTDRVCETRLRSQDKKVIYLCFPCSATLLNEGLALEHFAGGKHDLKLKSQKTWSRDIYDSHPYNGKLKKKTDDSSSGIGDTDVTKNAEGQEEKQVASAPVVAVNSQPANVTTKKEPEKKLAEYLLQGLTLEDGTTDRVCETRLRSQDKKVIYLCFPCSATLLNEGLALEHFAGGKHDLKLKSQKTWSKDIYDSHPYDGKLRKKTETLKPETRKPETRKPETPKPETPKPDMEMPVVDLSAECLIQHKINCNSGPLIGLEYLVEIVPIAGSPSYYCVLCSTPIAEKNVFKHFFEGMHQLRYLSQHFPTVCSGFVKLRATETQAKKILSKIIHAIRNKYGLTRPVQCPAIRWHNIRSEITDGVNKLLHISEKQGRTFIETLDQLPPDSDSATGGGANNNGEVYRLVLPRRRNDDSNKEEYEGQRRSVYCKPFISAHETRQDYVKIVAPLSRREEAQILLDDALKWLEYYKKYPVYHPQYKDEWEKFWTRRYQEVRAENKDPDAYDYKPEWKVYWEQRMVDLHEEETRRKREYLKELEFQITKSERRYDQWSPPRKRIARSRSPRRRPPSVGRHSRSPSRRRRSPLPRRSSPSGRNRDRLSPRPRLRAGSRDRTRVGRRSKSRDDIRQTKSRDDLPSPMLEDKASRTREEIDKLRSSQRGESDRSLSSHREKYDRSRSVHREELNESRSGHREELDKSRSNRKEELDKSRSGHQEELDKSRSRHRDESYKSRSSHREELGRSRLNRREESDKSRSGHQEVLDKSRSGHREELDKTRSSHREELDKSRSSHREELEKSRLNRREQKSDKQNKINIIIKSQSSDLNELHRSRSRSPLATIRIKTEPGTETSLDQTVPESGPALFSSGNLHSTLNNTTSQQTAKEDPLLNKVAPLSQPSNNESHKEFIEQIVIKKEPVDDEAQDESNNDVAALVEHLKNPEKHPQYNEEWQKFWTRRNKEVQALNKDPSKHDFKSEWIVFWSKRMVELHEEKMKEKTNKTQRKLDNSSDSSSTRDLSTNITSNREKSPRQRQRTRSPRRRSPVTRRRSPARRRSSPQRRSSPHRRRRSRSRDILRSSRTDESHHSDSRTSGSSSRHKAPEEVLPVLRRLVALEDYLGPSLGPKMLDLMSEALKMEKVEPKSSENLMDIEANTTLLEMVKEKLQGKVEVGLLGSANAAVKEVISSTTALLDLVQLRKQERQKQVAGQSDVTTEEMAKLVDTVVARRRPADTHQPVTRAGYLEENRTYGADRETGMSALKLLQVAYEPQNCLESREAKGKSASPEPDVMDGLSDSELKTLMQNFRQLSSDEQEKLVAYIRKLEVQNPRRIDRLRHFVNVASDQVSAPAISPSLSNMAVTQTKMAANRLPDEGKATSKLQQPTKQVDVGKLFDMVQNIAKRSFPNASSTQAITPTGSQSELNVGTNSTWPAQTCQNNEIPVTTDTSGWYQNLQPGQDAVQPGQSGVYGDTTHSHLQVGETHQSSNQIMDLYSRRPRESRTQSNPWSYDEQQRMSQKDLFLQKEKQSQKEKFLQKNILPKGNSSEKEKKTRQKNFWDIC